MAKFNSKACESISETTPEAKLNPNKFIPDSLIKKEEDTDKKHDAKLGRGIKYIPTIFFTPKMVSHRETEKPKEDRLLEKDDVDHLCDELEKCFLTPTKTEEESSSSDESSCEDEVDKDEASTKPEEVLGRVDTVTRFNYRTQRSYNVRRSTRAPKTPQRLAYD